GSDLVHEDAEAGLCAGSIEKGRTIQGNSTRSEELEPRERDRGAGAQLWHLVEHVGVTDVVLEADVPGQDAAAHGEEKSERSEKAESQAVHRSSSYSWAKFVTTLRSGSLFGSQRRAGAHTQRRSMRAEQCSLPGFVSGAAHSPRGGAVDRRGRRAFPRGRRVV